MSDPRVYPSPDDLGHAPVWDNYIVAQATAAALGLIPSSALAVGVTVAKRNVQLQFQLTSVSSAEKTDMADIVDEFVDLVGPEIAITVVVNEVTELTTSPLDGVRWIYWARIE